MIDLANEIRNLKVPEGKTAVYFLGQAGFIFKDENDNLTAVDLYLSDCCERFFGFRRLMPKLLGPSELTFDVIIASHAHYDHFDIDSMPLLTAHEDTVLYTSEEGLNECARLKIAKNVKLLKRGGTYFEKALKIEAVYCDHSDLAPDAVGLILTIGKTCIYITGDTAYRPEMTGDIAKRDIDFMTAPINGAYGNLNETEAVLLCSDIRPKLFVPCHYWNFAEHRGDPGLFAEKMKKMLPYQKYLLMGIGNSVII
jgi:L-ascorbate 6-phosphate lactonase